VCDNPVPAGYAYITFYEHEHAKNAINTFHRKKFDNLIMEVTWAKNVNTPENAIAKAEQFFHDQQARSLEQPKPKRVDGSNPVDKDQQVSLEYRFEGKVKRLGGKTGKLNFGHIEVSLQALRRYPLWKDGFATDVFWHHKDCSDGKLLAGDTVTFILTVAHTAERGNHFKAANIQKKSR
jgi:RNA recognition motif-containing protein